MSIQLQSPPDCEAPQSQPVREGVVRPIPVSAVTGLTRRMASGPDWRRTSRGLYVPADLPVEHATEQRIVEASAICPPDGALTGWAALRWMGARYFDGTYGDRQLPVTIAAGRRHVRARPGIVVSAEHVLPDEMVEVDGVRVTVPVSAASFEARHAPHGESAVRALDMALICDLVTLDELIEFTMRRLFITTGIAQLEAAICLASENCWSPTESTMRVMWEVEIGSRPLSNMPVFDRDGRHLGTPDLIDPVAGVVGEYDGEHHLQPEQREQDAERSDLYDSVGLEIVRMCRQDLRHRGPVLDRLAAAYFRAGRRSDRVRGWTTELPSYWVPTHTVEQRRALSEEQRARFLGWQEFVRA